MAHPAPTTLANAIRFLAIDAIVRATEGHQGVPLGMAEIATALYTRHLKFNPADPTWPDRDRVVLSNGHGSMLLYALLHLSGYEQISIDEIRRFREFGSHCEGHPEFDPAKGIEVTTGPLGQGIANAFGMAIAEAYLNARFGDGLVDHHTYAFVGDGCLQEGIGQEMISLAGHLRLGKLVLLWDDNRITDDGSTELSISEDVAARFRVADWHVVEVDGHDIEAVSRALAAAREDAASLADRLPHRDRARPGPAAGPARRPQREAAPRRTPRPPDRRSTGPTRRSRFRSRCFAPGGRPASAARASMRRGKPAAMPCLRPSARSSTALSRASCRRAGARRCSPASKTPSRAAKRRAAS